MHIRHLVSIQQCVNSLCMLLLLLLARCSGPGLCLVPEHSALGEDSTVCRRSVDAIAIATRKMFWAWTLSSSRTFSHGLSISKYCSELYPTGGYFVFFKEREHCRVIYFSKMLTVISLLLCACKNMTLLYG